MIERSRRLPGKLRARERRPQRLQTSLASCTYLGWRVGLADVFGLPRDWIRLLSMWIEPRHLRRWKLLLEHDTYIDMSSKSTEQKGLEGRYKPVYPRHGKEEEGGEVRNSNLDARQTRAGLQLPFIESRSDRDGNTAVKIASYVRRSAPAVPAARLVRVEFILPSG